ncbi:phage baseplate assembly protein V [Chryseobacterium sp. PMSZPI]|uniref:phage baseplate assembly protein V n=1 Tax=Chryseobacterium sp. PMSZPI TaxID=1033900 RepID=UPI001611CE88|nr:phage baseplate assembly protein V [Chryseobacterium sp. PMSZPI]
MKKNTSNAEKISENHISGINRVVKLDIVIDGKPISHFKHFHLQQSAKTHHYFELTLAHDSLGEAQNHNLEQAKQFFGKRLTVTFKYKDPENESPERTFVGVIMKVAFSQEKMSLGNIVLKGSSPTILMDSAPHTQSFGGSQPVNTSIIADRIIKESLGTNNFDFRIDTQNKGYINYSSQYCETHYNYLTRIAEAYGEQFYYDGEVLHFGKLPPHEKSIKLIEGSNASDVQIELNAIHIKPEYFGYNSSNHVKMIGVDNKIKHLGQLSSETYELNNNIFKTRSLTPAPVNPNMFLDIDDSQKSVRGSKAVDVFSVSGKTTVPFLFTGCVADLAMRKPDSNQTSHFTTLMMTEVNHEVDARGYYTGSFEAIAEGTGFMPKPFFVVPKAEPQVATVISNVDPLNQGRIQVRFDWQLNDTTHFIRMMSPDAGGTDAISQNRGFVAVPEIGDQVMVGFEYHNPDFPFAMGGMFHGKVGLGGGMDNHLKSIQTRSGIKVLMNDTERSVTIEDPSGNVYFMDGQGNINVTAPNKIIMNATDIQMNAYNNLEMNVSNNVIINAMSKFFVFTPFMKQVVSGFMSFFSGKALFSSSNTLDIEAKETKLHGTDKTIIHSDKQAIVNSKGTAEMYGESGNQLGNQAKKIGTTPTATLINTIVEFRTKQDGTYTGQFGFDWLRIDDNGVTTDTPYYDCLVNGYEAPNGKPPRRDSNTEYESKDEAFKALEKEYLHLPIKRISNPNLKKYYIPWLNLYPEAVSNASTSAIKPPCEAELRVLVDVETEEPDQIRMIFDKKYFVIDGKDGTDANPVLITDKVIGAKRDTGQTVKIRCIEEFSTRQEILVYAYPKGSLAKTQAEQLVLRKVAGKIVLEPNENMPASKGKSGIKNRKTQKVVLVQVKTNINGSSPLTGTFTNAEKENLQNALHQALIHGEFEDYVARDVKGQPLLDVVSGTAIDYFDLSNIDEFKIKTVGTTQVYGKFIYEKAKHDILFASTVNPTDTSDGGLFEDYPDPASPNQEFFTFLKAKFLAQTGNAKYSDYFIAFCFGAIPYDMVIYPSGGYSGTLGQVQKIGAKNVVLFDPRNDTTLNHEVLHGLGLYHTHETYFNKDVKFTFQKYETTNIMSYADSSHPSDEKITSWHWQWKIIKRNVK